MHLDIFSSGNSFFHRLDPRAKIIVFVPLVFAVALTESIPVAVVYLLVSGLFVLVACLPLKELLKRQLVLNAFMIFLWLTVPFSVEGQALFEYKGLVFSEAGARMAGLITLKANAIFIFTCSLIATTEIFALGHALFHLKCPRKLVYLSFFLYRYIGVLHEEYEKLLNAVKMRAFRPGTNRRTFRTLAYIVGMLFVNSYGRSQRVYQALILRGFREDFPMLMHFHCQRKDICFAVIMTLGIFTQVVLWR